MVLPAGCAVAVRARPSGGRGQSGFSLLEVLMSVVLLATVVVSVAAGMLTLMRLTHASSQSQRLQVALTSFTESLSAVPYVPCTSPGSATPDAAAYSFEYDALGGEWDRHGTPSGVVTTVEYWHDDVAPVAAPNRFGDYAATCPAGDRGRQRLTVVVTDADGTARTGQVVIAAVGP